MHSQSDASDKRPTALAGTLGPESLPRRVVPVHDASPQADSEAEHGLGGETDELTQTEALEQ
jgi:hypothetical protein